MESRCPVTGYHHPHSNKDTESTQDIRYKERTNRIIKALVNQHRFRLRLAFLGHIKEQFSQGIVRVHHSESICWKIKRKKILYTAVYPSVIVAISITMAITSY